MAVSERGKEGGDGALSLFYTYSPHLFCLSIIIIQLYDMLYTGEIEDDVLQKECIFVLHPSSEYGCLRAL